VDVISGPPFRQERALKILILHPFFYVNVLLDYPDMVFIESVLSEGSACEEDVFPKEPLYQKFPLLLFGPLQEVLDQ